ncbi:hypothetical protein GGI25_004983 [Coemansia spiralis]|uniref:Chitosanase n=2 Tax=Coemansia TaxID=4863 RepID=A0A9W8G3I0_9FUNG|nr:hypothetical protein EDC05_004857 [Coemansia umbellata]KAJ2620119.1 hypothetical protein GGI26_005291 [Coemansia sp. RSA 1358]KAJ2672788.1 hypothetical protein GGI25_004983 [Coemansia spiralis]
MVKFVTLATGLATISMLATAHAGLSGCPKNLAFQLTNVFQIGQIHFEYGNCAKDNTGNGYAAGIANFCTRTGDAWQVIQAYHNLTGGNDEFTQFDSILKQYAETNSGSTSGLDGYCNAWQKASASQKFWSAQGAIFDKLYFTPSQGFADSLGLQLSVSQGQMYDAAISHGTSNNSRSLGGMIQTTNSKFANDTLGGSNSTLSIGGYQVDEIEWLKEFINVRKAIGSKNNLASINSYNYIINQTEYVWVHDIKVLNGQGEVGDVTCDHTYLPGEEPLLNTPPVSGGSSTRTNIDGEGTDGEDNTGDEDNTDGHSSDDDDDGSSSESWALLDVSRVLLTIAVAFISAVLIVF